MVPKAILLFFLVNTYSIIFSQVSMKNSVIKSLLPLKLLSLRNQTHISWHYYTFHKMLYLKIFIQIFSILFYLGYGKKAVTKKSQIHSLNMIEMYFSVICNSPEERVCCRALKLQVTHDLGFALPCSTISQGIVLICMVEAISSLSLNSRRWENPR